MGDHGLTPNHLAILADILAPFAGRIRSVGLFGSRATGKAKPYSDIDLVIDGDVDEALIGRLLTLFAESALPLKVDLVGYGLIDHPPLKAHIDAVMRPLFTQNELAAHARDASVS